MLQNHFDWGFTKNEYIIFKVISYDFRQGVLEWGELNFNVSPGVEIRTITI